MDKSTILQEKDALKSEALNIIENCKSEIRGLTEEENERINAIKERLNAIDEEIRSCSNSDKEEKSEENPKEEPKERAEEPAENKEDDKEKEGDSNPEDKKDEKEEERNASENTNTEKNINIQNIKMEKRFSILTAIKNIANNQPQDDVTAAVLAEGNREMRKAGLNFVGQIQLPVETRALTVADEGEDVVATDFLDIVKPLQARNVMLQAGARFVTGLVGDIQYPVMTNANCTWEGETASAKNGSPTFSNIKLSPKRLTTYVPISKQFLIQDSVGAEQAIREEIINAINAKLEATILGTEAGTATQPAGLLENVTNTVNDFEEICALEAKLEEANVYGDLKYIVSPKAKAALRNMPKSEKVTQLVYENNEIDGTPALSTSFVKETNFVYGDFSQYVIAQWGNLDITVDNVTLAGEGQIKLIINAYFDAKPLRKEAFVTGKVGA